MTPILSNHVTTVDSRAHPFAACFVYQEQGQAYLAFTMKHDEMVLATRVGSRVIVPKNIQNNRFVVAMPIARRREGNTRLLGFLDAKSEHLLILRQRLPVHRFRLLVLSLSA